MQFLGSPLGNLLVLGLEATGTPGAGPAKLGGAPGSPGYLAGGAGGGAPPPPNSLLMAFRTPGFPAGCPVEMHTQLIISTV